MSINLNPPQIGLQTQEQLEDSSIFFIFFVKNLCTHQLYDFKKGLLVFHIALHLLIKDGLVHQSEFKV